MHRNPSSLAPLAFRWPAYVRRQFRAELLGSWEILANRDRSDGAAIRQLNWAPLRELDQDQVGWMLGRLMQVWVLGEVPDQEITAWDEAGALAIWSLGFSVRGERDAATGSARREAFQLTDVVTMLRRHFATEFADYESEGPCRAPLVYAPSAENSGEYVFDQEDFLEVAGAFLDRAFPDESHLWLDEVQPGLWAPAMSPADLAGAGLPAGYFRCPIPTRLAPPLLTLARRLLARPVPAGPVQRLTRSRRDQNLRS